MGGPSQGHHPGGGVRGPAGPSASCAPACGDFGDSCLYERGRRRDSIENILFKATSGISKHLPADRVGPIVKAFEAMHDMVTEEAKAAQREQRDRGGEQLLREGALPTAASENAEQVEEDDMDDTTDRRDKAPRTAAPDPPAVERAADVGPLATQPPSATPARAHSAPRVTASREFPRDRSPRRAAQGTPASTSTAASGSLEATPPSPCPTTRTSGSRRRARAASTRAQWST